MTRHQVILGIDPGSRVMGYAFIRARIATPVLPRDFAVIDAGVLRVGADQPHPVRLGLLHEALYELAALHRPGIAVLEKAFVDKNVSSAIKLGEARGAFIAACSRVGAAIDEITPAEVKKTITGNGRADKELVSLALKTLTGFDRGALPADVTDALAIALCYGLKLSPRWAVLPPSPGAPAREARR